MTLVHNHAVWHVIFSPDGTRVATASNNAARIWDVTSGLEIARLEHENRARMVAFDPTGTYLVTASEDGTARAWDPMSGEELKRLSHDDTVISARFSPDGRRIVTASWDRTACIWDPKSGRQLARLQHEQCLVNAFFTNDGNRVVTDCNIPRIWDALAGRELLRFPHSEYVREVAISRDGTRLATASDDRAARVWDAASGKELVRLQHAPYTGTEPKSEVTVDSVSFNADGTRVVTSAWDHAARIWDTGSGREITRFNHDGYIRSARFSKDGTRVLALGAVFGDENPDDPDDVAGEFMALVWDAESGKELFRLRHDKWINAAAFDECTALLVTGSDDNTARIWHIAQRSLK